MNLEALTDDELRTLKQSGVSGLSDDAIIRLKGAINQPSPSVDEMTPGVFGMSLPEPVEAGLVGAGKTLSDIGAGAQKLYYGLTGNEQALGDLENQQQIEQEYYNKLASERPYSTLAGEVAPYLATAPLSGGLITQAGIGAAGEGLRYGSDQASQAGSGALWSMGGYGVGRIAPRVVGTIRGIAQSNRAALKALPKAQQRLIERADDLNIGLTPGQRLGSKPLQQLEASAEAMPFTSGLTEEMGKVNQSTLNKLAAEAIGETADDISGDVLARAADRIGGVYDNIAADVKAINLGKTKLANMFDDMGTEAEQRIVNYVKKFPELESGTITGKTFNALRQRTGKDIRSAFSAGNGQLAEDLIEFQKIMDKALIKAKPKAAAELSEAGKQWRVLKALESGRAVDELGNVKPASLSGALRRIDKGGYLRGRNKSDFYDAVRISTGLRPKIGDSGTATRSWLLQGASDPTQFVGGAALRYPFKKYLESGGSPVWANALGAYPSSGLLGQIGGGTGRAGSAAETEFPELFE